MSEACSGVNVGLLWKTVAAMIKILPVESAYASSLYVNIRGVYWNGDTDKTDDNIHKTMAEVRLNKPMGVILRAHKLISMLTVSCYAFRARHSKERLQVSLSPCAP